VIRRWNADVKEIRNQRAAVAKTAALPIPSREMRKLAANIAQVVGADPPSANQVRRRLGAWYRGALRDRAGPILPPDTDLPSILRQLADAGRDLAPQAERELERIVLELVAEASSGAPAVGSNVADG